MKSGVTVKCLKNCGRWSIAAAAVLAVTRACAAAAGPERLIIMAATTWPKNLGACIMGGVENNFVRQTVGHRLPHFFVHVISIVIMGGRNKNVNVENKNKITK